MIINGKKGEINRENNNSSGHIVGRYSKINDKGKYVHNTPLYVVWDWDKPIWKLLKFFERTDPEYLEKIKMV